jgi:mannose-6-phosphate isomerase-like protein (cupin superfamily)
MRRLAGAVAPWSYTAEHEQHTAPVTDPTEEMQMEASSEYPKVKDGEGYAVGQLDDLGEGPGFRKVRKGLGVTAFGVNAIVMPPGIETGFHYHDVQEELYFVHRGSIEMEFGDGSVERLGEGAFVRVDAPTVRKIRNPGEVEAVYLCAGGKDGYIGRDGRVPEGEEQRVSPIGGSGERA